MVMPLVNWSHIADYYKEKVMQKDTGLVILTKEEGQKLLYLIRMLACSDTVTTSKRELYSMHELDQYSDLGSLDLVIELDRLTKEV
jgi:hypothetical protein